MKDQNLSDAIGLEIERREKILHESLECGHDLVEEQPCAQCRLEARIEALEKKWSIVFDGYSVLQGLTEEQKLFVSPEAVAAVLDSVAKLAALQEPTK